MVCKYSSRSRVDCLTSLSTVMSSSCLRPKSNRQRVPSVCVENTGLERETSLRTDLRNIFTDCEHSITSADDINRAHTDVSAESTRGKHTLIAVDVNLHAGCCTVKIQTGPLFPLNCTPTGIYSLLWSGSRWKATMKCFWLAWAKPRSRNIPTAQF